MLTNSLFHNFVIQCTYMCLYTIVIIQIFEEINFEYIMIRLLNTNENNPLPCI